MKLYDLLNKSGYIKDASEEGVLELDKKEITSKEMS